MKRNFTSLAIVKPKACYKKNFLKRNATLNTCNNSLDAGNIIPGAYNSSLDNGKVSLETKSFFTSPAFTPFSRDGFAVLKKAGKLRQSDAAVIAPFVRGWG
jgi:hypothetical protein